jgi:hypothetical protein
MSLIRTIEVDSIDSRNRMANDAAEYEQILPT